MVPEVDAPSSPASSRCAAPELHDNDRHDEPSKRRHQLRSPVGARAADCHKRAKVGELRASGTTVHGQGEGVRIPVHHMSSREVRGRTTTQGVQAMHGRVLRDLVPGSVEAKLYGEDRKANRPIVNRVQVPFLISPSASFVLSYEFCARKCDATRCDRSSCASPKNATFTYPRCDVPSCLVRYSDCSCIFPAVMCKAVLFEILTVRAYFPQ